MRNRIWNEVTDSKYYLEFTILYAERQRFYWRLYSIGILVFSTSGIFGWFLWDKISIIACIIISAVSLLRLIQPHFIHGEKEIANIDKIQKFYVGYNSKLEKLWLDYQNKKIKDDEANEMFFCIKAEEAEMITIINETLRYKPKKLTRKAKEHCDDYFKRVFFTSNN